VLDNSNSFNANYPMLGLLGTDNLYLSDKNLSGASQIERNVYLWVKDIFQTATATEFSSPYNKISAVNVVLAGLEKLGPSKAEKARALDIGGQALFHRAFAYYSLAQLFCKPFTSQSAATDAGLQLRISPDPNIIVKRSTVAQTYDFIIRDLKEALEMLPEKPALLTRPGKRACRGLLAKVYLAMADYEHAKQYADLALTDQVEMLDFNSPVIKPSESFVFPPYSNPHPNPEMIFYANSQSWASIWPVYGVANVDSTLYRSYATGDLRKTLFFRNDSQGKPQFTGSYSGTYFNFGGIASNELLLIKAESLARTGEPAESVALINQLLSARFEPGKFRPYIHQSDKQTLELIMTERRKELPFTGQLRWEDLRRIPPQTPVVHLYQGTRYELPGSDLRWVFPFPDQEISLSAVEQNPR
jgi:hypothetical protein